MDNARFYHPDTGEIVDKVLRAKPKKLPDGSESLYRDINVGDARKIGLLPSVTTIIKDQFATSFQLIDWMIDQHILACMDFPYKECVSFDSQAEEKQKYMDMIKAKANEYRNITADIGKEIHDAIDQYLSRGIKPENPVHLKICESLSRFLSENNVGDVICERPLFGKEAGFAGTPDIYGSNGWVIDTKTTSFKSFHKPYESWKLQLGAYDLLLGAGKTAQFVADRDTGETVFIKHDDPVKWSQCFLRLRDNWYAMNDFKPTWKVA